MTKGKCKKMIYLLCKKGGRRQITPTCICLYMHRETGRIQQRLMRELRDFPGGTVVKTVLLLQGARVRSLVRELRSHILPGVAKNKYIFKKRVKVRVMVMVTGGQGKIYFKHVNLLFKS